MKVVERSVLGQMRIYVAILSPECTGHPRAMKYAIRRCEGLPTTRSEVREDIGRGSIDAHTPLRRYLGE